jgi:hypothetical protein
LEDHREAYERALRFEPPVLPATADAEPRDRDRRGSSDGALSDAREAEKASHAATPTARRDATKERSADPPAKLW